MRYMLLALGTVFALGLAQAAPPSPPPPPASPKPPAAPFDVCRDRYSLLYERSPYMEIRPCTIKATENGRLVELGPTTGPNAYEDAKGRPRRLLKVIFRSFVPGPPLSNGMMGVTKTGRTLSVSLHNHPPSPIAPYTVKLPPAICRADYWVLSILLSDGTEMVPFGVINSMCGPNAQQRQ